MEKITPIIDIAFKKIFGVEENTDLLISLINSIVSPEDQVKDVTLLNPYNPKRFWADKLSILDIKARGVEGKMFNIEIQITDLGDYDKKALYYWAKLYTEQLKNGENYSELSKAIGIHILQFTSIVETPKYHNVFHIREKDSGIHYFKDLELHTIELKKFSPTSREALSSIIERVKSSLDMWLTFLTNHNLLNKEDLPIELEDRNLKKALDVIEVMNFTSDEREAYEGHLKWMREEASAIDTAEKKGEERGREEGEKIKAIEIARKMLAKNKSIEEIIEFTGLAEKEIKKLN